VPVIKTIRNGDGCWPDLTDIGARMKDGRVIHLGNGAPAIQMALLKAGMGSGKASVTIRLDLPDGRVVLAETSLSLLVTAVDVLKAMDDS
jgi:hypothetical protein